MITLNMSAPQTLASFDTVMALVALATDPKACSEQLLAIKEAASESAAVIAQADDVRAEFAKEREALAAERVEHTKQIADDRAVFEKECARRDGLIKDREAEVAKLQAEAQAARDDAAKTAEDLRLRLERVRSAAA